MLKKFVVELHTLWDSTSDKDSLFCNAEKEITTTKLCSSQLSETSCFNKKEIVSQQIYEEVNSTNSYSENEEERPYKDKVSQNSSIRQNYVFVYLLTK